MQAAFVDKAIVGDAAVGAIGDKARAKADSIAKKEGKPEECRTSTKHLKFKHSSIYESMGCPASRSDLSSQSSTNPELSRSPCSNLLQQTRNRRPASDNTN